MNQDQSFEDTVTNLISGFGRLHPAGLLGSAAVTNKVIAAHNADLIRVLEELKESINASSTMHPLYAELDRDRAIDNARNTVIGHITQAIQKIKGEK